MPLGGGDLELALKIRADLSRAVKELERLRKGQERAGKGAKVAARDMDRAEKSIGRVGGAAARAAQRWLALGTVLVGMRRSMRAVIDASVRQEQALAQVEARLKSTGSAVPLAEIEAMAAAFQEVTSFGDEAVLELSQVLLTFTKIHDLLPETTEIVLDMSTALGRDLTSTAIQVGKALQDPVLGATALREAGVNLTEAQRDQIQVLVENNNLLGAQKLILEELQVEFAGSARAARDTLGGALQAVSNELGDLFEVADTAEIREALESLADTLRDPAVQRGAQVIAESLIRLFESSARGAAHLALAAGALADIGSGPLAQEQAAAAGSEAEGARLRRLAQLRREADAEVSRFLDLAAQDPAFRPALDTYIEALRASNVGLSDAINARLGEVGIAPLQREFEAVGEAAGQALGEAAGQALGEAAGQALGEAAGEALAEAAERFGPPSPVGRRVSGRRRQTGPQRGTRVIGEEDSRFRGISLGDAADRSFGDAAGAARTAGEAIRDAMVGAFDRAGDALVEFAVTGEATFRGFVEAILADLARIALQRLVIEPLANALFGAPAGGAAGAGGGVGVGHGGGVAGELAVRRYGVPALAFAGAPRLHGGGVAGFGPGEVPTILKRGETVLPVGAAIVPPPVTVRVENRGTPQDIVRTEQRMDAEGYIVNVITDDAARRGPITRVIDAVARGAGS